jgi:site-specific DNA-methyltransferase (cytosine-N4-specific)
MGKVIEKNLPELEILPFDDVETRTKYASLISQSGIEDFSPQIEVWTSGASNKALAYHSHGIFRYFGKFPPPVARHLIKEYSREGDLVIDPMCGSGTTALEALLLNRRANCFDVNPLSTLISRVKVTPFDKNLYVKTLNKIVNKYPSLRKVEEPYLVGLKKPEHWFLPETTQSLAKIKNLIKELSPNSEIRDALTVALLSVVRRVSRATTQQGRLFLDVETAEKDAFPFFQKKALDIGEAIGGLPEIKADLNIQQRSIFDEYDKSQEKAKLVICHPPYFNSYKYSGVNSLELSWFGVDHASVRKAEVREAFKVGKPEKVEEYLEDMEDGLRNLAQYLKPKGRTVLMIGDTVIKGEYIPVTHKLVSRLQDVYKVEKAALRIPKFTEASWAASQRRKGGDVGVNLCDLMVILQKI